MKPPTPQDRHSRILDLWLARPRSARTDDDVLAFYGWLTEHESGLIPSGGGFYRQLQEILSGHIVGPEPRKKT